MTFQTGYRPDSLYMKHARWLLVFAIACTSSSRDGVPSDVGSGGEGGGVGKPAGDGGSAPAGASGGGGSAGAPAVGGAGVGGEAREGGRAGGGGGGDTPSGDAGITIDAGPIATYTVFPFDSDEAKRRQRDTAAAYGVPVDARIDLGGGVAVAFVLIPAGRTRVGSPPNVPGYENEKLRDVTIARPFYMGKFQVTRAQYRALEGRFPTQDPRGNALKMGDSPNQPALESYAYVRGQLLQKLQARAPVGWKLRLPTGDEWEHAARAGTATVWYAGDAEGDLAKIGWYVGNAKGVLRDVGLLAPNPWGLHDMVGNAWHWVFKPTGDYNDADPRWHMVRGGACNETAFGNGCRTANEQIQDVPVGYRFVADLPAR